MILNELGGSFSVGNSQVVPVVKNLPANAGNSRDTGLIPGSGRYPGEGNGNPLQYSCLENPRGRGGWWMLLQSTYCYSFAFSHLRFLPLFTFSPLWFLGSARPKERATLCHLQSENENLTAFSQSSWHKHANHLTVTMETSQWGMHALLQSMHVSPLLPICVSIWCLSFSFWLTSLWW